MFLKYFSIRRIIKRNIRKAFSYFSLIKVAGREALMDSVELNESFDDAQLANILDLLKKYEQKGVTIDESDEDIISRARITGQNEVDSFYRDLQELLAQKLQNKDKPIQAAPVDPRIQSYVQNNLPRINQKQPFDKPDEYVLSNKGQIYSFIQKDLISKNVSRQEAEFIAEKFVRSMEQAMVSPETETTKSKVDEFLKEHGAVKRKIGQGRRPEGYEYTGDTISLPTELSNLFHSTKINVPGFNFLSEYLDNNAKTYAAEAGISKYEYPPDYYGDEPKNKRKPMVDTSAIDKASSNAFEEFFAITLKAVKKTSGGHLDKSLGTRYTEEEDKRITFILKNPEILKDFLSKRQIPLNESGTLESPDVNDSTKYFTLEKNIKAVEWYISEIFKDISANGKSSKYLPIVEQKMLEDTKENLKNMVYKEEGREKPGSQIGGVSEEGEERDVLDLAQEKLKYELPSKENFREINEKLAPYVATKNKIENDLKLLKDTVAMCYDNMAEYHYNPEVGSEEEIATSKVYRPEKKYKRSQMGFMLADAIRNSIDLTLNTFNDVMIPEAAKKDKNGNITVGFKREKEQKGHRTSFDLNDFSWKNLLNSSQLGDEMTKIGIKKMEAKKLYEVNKGKMSDDALVNAVSKELKMPVYYVREAIREEYGILEEYIHPEIKHSIQYKVQGSIKLAVQEVISKIIKKYTNITKDQILKSNFSKLVYNRAYELIKDPNFANIKEDFIPYAKNVLNNYMKDFNQLPEIQQIVTEATSIYRNVIDTYAKPELIKNEMNGKVDSIYNDPNIVNEEKLYLRKIRSNFTVSHDLNFWWACSKAKLNGFTNIEPEALKTFVQIFGTPSKMSKEIKDDFYRLTGMAPVNLKGNVPSEESEAPIIANISALTIKLANLYKMQSSKQFKFASTINSDINNTLNNIIRKTIYEIWEAS